MIGSVLGLMLRKKPNIEPSIIAVLKNIALFKSSICQADCSKCYLGKHLEQEICTPSNIYVLILYRGSEVLDAYVQKYTETLRYSMRVARDTIVKAKQEVCLEWDGSCSTCKLAKLIGEGVSCDSEDMTYYIIAEMLANKEGELL